MYMNITATYTKKDTKYCSLPRLKHIDTCSHLILVIFQRNPFSNSLKHGVFFQLLFLSWVHPLTLDVVLWTPNRPAVNRQNQNSAKIARKRFWTEVTMAEYLQDENERKPTISSSLLVCPLCSSKRKSFTCDWCIQNGNFDHSSGKYSER